MQTKPYAKYSKLAVKVNQIIREFEGKTKARPVFNASQMRFKVLKQGNRCIYCGLSLSLGSKSFNSMQPIFYIPLDRGGPIDEENLVIACPDCANHHRPTRELRTGIPDISTFADYVEVLARTCYAKEQARESGDGDLFLRLEEKGNRIKRLMNLELEDIAISMKYKPFQDWIPENFEMIKEDDNDIPTLVEQVIEDKDTEENKKKVTDKVKQIVSTGQYRIIE